MRWTRRARRLHVERFRIKAVREGIVHKKVGDGQKVRVVKVGDAVVLQGAEGVGIAQFIPQLSEDVEAALGPLLSECTLKMVHEVSDDVIIVEHPAPWWGVPLIG